MLADVGAVAVPKGLAPADAWKLDATQVPEGEARAQRSLALQNTQRSGSNVPDAIQARPAADAAAVTAGIADAGWAVVLYIAVIAAPRLAGARRLHRGRAAGDGTGRPQPRCGRDAHE